MRNGRTRSVTLGPRDEILLEKVWVSMANKRPSIPAEVVFQRLEARHARKVKTAKRRT
jgi:hypothetical protein